MKLTGVIGRIALFKKGDQTVGLEEGNSGHGIKVVSIKGYEVTIEHEGKSETLRLFSGSGADNGGRPGREESPPAPSESAKTGGPATQPSATKASADVETKTVPEKVRRAQMRRRTGTFRTKADNSSAVIESGGEAVIRAQEEP